MIRSVATPVTEDVLRPITGAVKVRAPVLPLLDEDGLPITDESDQPITT
jgi:hypothetical protein